MFITLPLCAWPLTAGPKIRNGLRQAFLQRDLRLPAVEKRVGEGDVGLALLGIVRRKRLVDEL